MGTGLEAEKVAVHETQPRKFNAHPGDGPDSRNDWPATAASNAGVRAESLEVQLSKPYWQKLQDPRWQRKRLEILNRAGWKCEKCGNAEDARYADEEAMK